VGRDRTRYAGPRWELAVGDDTLTEDEIAALAETKAPLIRLRGQWVAVDPEQLRRGLEFLAREPTGQATAAEILALAARHPDDADTPLGVTTVRADGWLGDLLSGAVVESLQPVEPPPGFTATLRPYQQRGLSWLAFLASLGLGSCLADDMGLGKTVQLLAMESLQRHQDPDTGPTLLLCPMSLVGNWQREAARFAPGVRVYAHHGGARLRGDALHERLEDIDLMVTTYEMLVPHLAARFGQDVLYLHGGTPKKRRDEMVARFQSGDGPPIFLLSLKAGGTGLNLTAANHVVHLDATFYLLAESFDEDPFAILAWRGREREDLLDNLQAARSDGPPAADWTEPAGRPLADCLDSYFARQADMPSPSPPVASPTALLEQLPDVTIAVRDRPLAELLRPAYVGLGSVDLGERSD
jgi:SNF2 family DNA or RNA helicase